MTQNERDIKEALDYLRHVLSLLKRAKAPKTVERVRLAISSAKGALRNAGYKAVRAQCAGVAKKTKEA